MQTVSIVCPVYNEAEGIEQFYRELAGVTASIDGYTFEYIFVVDKSPDGTWEIVARLAARDPRLKPILLSRRFGHQMSLVAGIDRSNSDIIIMMDADQQHPPSLIPEMLKKHDQGFDIVYTVRNDAQSVGPLKRFLSKAFYRLIKHLASVDVHPNASDFRLISRRVAGVFKKNIREPNQFLRGLFSWVGFNSTGIQFTTGKRNAGKSKYNLRSMLKLALAGILSFSTVPLRLAITFGCFIAACSFIYGAYIFITYLRSGIPVTGWTSLGLLVSFLGGLQLIFLGVLGEYIGAIFDAVKGRPLYIVEKEINYGE